MRLSHAKKQAFLNACEEQSDTPSSVLRRFIDSYIRRANLDNLQFAFLSAKNATVRHWLKISVSVLTLFFGFLFALKIYAGFESHNRVIDKSSLFSIYDENGDELITLGEISKNDSHLHHVLDVDLTKGISIEEFKIQGKMQWLAGKSKEGKFPARDWSERKQVEFNLGNPKNIQINAWVLNEPPRDTIQVADRLVTWSMEDNRASLVLEEITIRNDENGKISTSFKRPYYPSKTYKEIDLPSKN